MKRVEGFEESPWLRGNLAFREKKYALSIKLYEQALRESKDELKPRIEFNLELAKRKLSTIGKLEAIKKPNNINDIQFKLITDSKLFDPDWYLSQYKNIHNIKTDPLEHYLNYGTSLSTNPSEDFDTAYYLKIHKDVADAGMNPLLHYVCQGYKENRVIKPSGTDFNLESFQCEVPKYVPRIPKESKSVKLSARIIAFYLPQFHPIPENNEWWGDGFTEWTNVRPAEPQFRDHYQPHVPDDYLGYYDLRENTVMHKQIELAKLYGIEGFCFYAYWFNGKRLLETPIDNYLNDKTLNLPFCVCWANENWSRRWDGLDHKILIEQRYSNEDDLAFINHMAKYLRDSRYIRVDGKPLLIIYRPNLFPDMKCTVKRWRDWCRKNGLGEIYIAYVQSFEKRNPIEYGIDAAIEFPPNRGNPPNVTTEAVDLSPKFSGLIYDWRIFLKRSQEYESTTYPLFRGACPSWDNTARRKDRGTIFVNSDPKLFENWLVNAIEDSVIRFPKQENRLIFINAWNEWGEGAHLEPDQRYGYAWLQAIRNAHNSVMQSRSTILLVSHDAHPHGAQYLILEIGRLLKKIGYKVSFLLLGGGRLLADFKQIGQVFNAEENDKASLEVYLNTLRKLGTVNAITSTVVSGSSIPLLKDYCYRVVSLIHELPGVIKQFNQKDNAVTIAKLSDKLVFPSRHVYEHFKRIIPVDAEKVVISHQGVLRNNPFKNHREEARRIVFEKHDLPIDSSIILNIAYVDMRKGADLFVEIAAITLRTYPDAVFLWIGHAERELQDTIFNRIRTLGLEKRVLFLGFEKEPMAYYAAADVFALTSREDPFPNVVLEAAEVGVPVVAFAEATGASNFIVENGGLLAQAFETNTFSNAICRLLEKPTHSEESSVKTLQTYVLDILNELNGLNRVSVVVPNYNYENHIKSRLACISSQSHPIYELVVLDDASTDNSVEIIEKCIEPLTFEKRFIVNKTNSGSVFRQWRRGISLCRGDLVWIAEADDLCDPNMLAELATAFNDPSVVMAYCQSQQIDENGALLANDYLYYTKEVSSKWADNHYVEGIEEIGCSLSIKNTIPNVSAVVFRRTALLAALEEIGDNLFDYHVAGDWLVYINVLKKGKCFFCAKPLNMHRRHTSSVTTSTKLQRHMDEVLEMQQLAQAIAKPSSDVIAKANGYSAKLMSQFGLTTK